jgi:hypothetical protein
MITDARVAMKYWEIIADNLSKAGWSLAGSQLLIAKAERSGLLMHIVTTDSVSWYTRMKAYCLP